MKTKYLVKVLQRKFYDTFSKKYFLFLYLILFFLLSFMSLIILQKTFSNSQNVEHFFLNKQKNYNSNVDLLRYLYQPHSIDVVYTWVNGSDPLLINKLVKTTFDLQKTYIKYGHISSDHCLSKKNYSYFETPFNLLPNNVLTSFSSFQKNVKVFNIYKNKTLVYFKSIDEAQNFLSSKNDEIDAFPMFIKVDCNFLSPLPETNPSLKTISFSPLILISGLSNLSNHQILRLFTFQQQSLIYDIFHYSSQNLTMFILNVQELSIIEAICNRLKSFLKKKANVFSQIQLVVGDYNFIKKQEHVDDALLSKRFADNDELKYSLRSLEKFAPWFRYVYVVTNGQIPNWLNLNNERIKIVTHKEIFVNKSDLPTFNSAAIECHLHRIPNLSDTFIYMNDDIILGKPVFPEDFYSVSKGYKMYLSWSLPNCKPSCPNTWLKDGYCDINCNTSDCFWDGGDCLHDSSKINFIQTNTEINFKKDTVNYCSINCLDTWLADRFCDHVCNNAKCAYDMGDCGMSNYYQFPNKILKISETFYRFQPSSVIYLNLDDFLTNSSTKILSAFYEHNLSVKLISINIRLKALTVLLQTNITQSNITILINYQHFQYNLNFTCELIIGYNHSSSIKKNENKKQLDLVTPIIIVKENTDQTKIELSSFEHKPQILYNVTLVYNDTELDDMEKTLNEAQNQTLQYQLDKLKILKNKGYLTNQGFSFGKYQMIQDILNRTKTKIQGKFPWEKIGFFEYISKKSQISEKYETKYNNRRLMDTFGDSLLHVNQIYNQEFGYLIRKVPAHMAHYINKQIIVRLHNKFENQFKETSSHKFRSSEDMQFAFSYYYFLMSETETRDIDFILQLYDTDNSRSLSKNELRSLMVSLYDLPLHDDSIEEFNHQLYACVNKSVNENNLKDDGINQDISIEIIRLCYNLTDKLILKFGQVQKNKYQILSDEEVSFQMVKSNVTLTTNALDVLRKNPKKFMCFNDDMDYSEHEESKKVKSLLKDFYQYHFPFPSSFEHSFGVRNKFRNVQEYLTWKKLSKSNKMNNLNAINVITTNFLITIFYIIFGFFFFFATFKIIICYLKRKRKIFTFK